MATNTTATQQASATLQNLRAQNRQKTSVKEATSADKKLLSVSRYYGTQNELLKDMYSATKNYNENMFEEAARRGELQTYFALLEVNKDNTLSDDFYDPLMFDYDTYMAELSRPEVDDTEKTLKERFTQEFDPATNSYKEVSIGEMTDRQYLDYTIEQNRQYQRQDIEYQLQAYQKESMNGWEKFGHSLGQVIGEFFVGIGESTAGLFDIFGALGYSIYRAGATQGQELFTDSLVDYFGEISLISKYRESVRAGLDEWERRYGLIKNIDGSSTSLGGALASISNSFGMMIPGIAIGALTGGAGIPLTFGAKVPLGFTAFYASMFSGNMYENAVNQKLEKNPSFSLVLNAALKTTSQAVIEWGLGKILGGTIGNSLLGLGSRGALKGAAKIGKGAVATYLLKQAGQEGLEEFLQDMGDMLIDTTFSWFRDGYTQGIDFQQLMDSFIIGAASSLLLAGFSVGSQEIRSAITHGNNNFDIFYKQNGETKKVRGFSRLVWRDMLNTFNENINAIREGRLSEKATVRTLESLGATYETLGQFFDGITEERIAKAKALFNEYLNADIDTIGRADLEEWAKEQFPEEEITPELLRTVYDEDVSFDEDAYQTARHNIANQLTTQLSNDVDAVLIDAKISATVKAEIKKAIEKNIDILGAGETTHIVRAVNKNGETVGENANSITVKKKRQQRKQKAARVNEEVENIWKRSQATIDDLSQDYEWIFTTDGGVAMEIEIDKEKVRKALLVPNKWVENYKGTTIRNFLVNAKIIEILTTEEIYKPVYEAMVTSYKDVTGFDLRKRDPKYSNIKNVKLEERIILDTLFNEEIFQHFLFYNKGENVHDLKIDGKNILFTLASLVETLGKQYAKNDKRKKAILDKLYEKIKQTMRRPVLKAVINWNMDPQLSGANEVLPPADIEFINSRKAREAVILTGEERSAYAHTREQILNGPYYVSDNIKEIIEKGSQKNATEIDKLKARAALDILDNRLLMDLQDILKDRADQLRLQIEEGLRVAPFKYFKLLSSELEKAVNSIPISKAYQNRWREVKQELIDTMKLLSTINDSNFIRDYNIYDPNPDTSIWDKTTGEIYIVEEIPNYGLLFTKMFSLLAETQDLISKTVIELSNPLTIKEHAKSSFSIPVKACAIGDIADVQHYADVINKFKNTFGVSPDVLYRLSNEEMKIYKVNIDTLNAAKEAAGIFDTQNFIINYLRNMLGDGYSVFKTPEGRLEITKFLSANELFNPVVLEGNINSLVYHDNGIVPLPEGIRDGQVPIFDLLSDKIKAAMIKLGKASSLQNIMVELNVPMSDPSDRGVTLVNKNKKGIFTGEILLANEDYNTLYHEIGHVFQNIFELPNGTNPNIFGTLYDNVELKQETFDTYRVIFSDLFGLTGGDTYSDIKNTSAEYQEKVNNAINYVLYLLTLGEVWARAYAHNETVYTYILKRMNKSKGRYSLYSPISKKTYTLELSSSIFSQVKSTAESTNSTMPDSYQVNSVEEAFIKALEAHDARYMNENTNTNYHSAFTGRTSELLDDLLSDSIPAFRRFLVSVDQIIRKPQDYLKKSILDQIQDKSEGGVYRFLQNYFFKQGKGYNIDIHKKTQQYIFVNDNAFADITTPEMSEAIDADDDYDFVEAHTNKTNKLSDFIDKKALRQLNIPVDIDVVISTNKDAINETQFNDKHKNGIIYLKTDEYTTNAELAMKIMHEFRHVLQYYNFLEGGFTNDFKVSPELLADVKKHYPGLFTNKIIRDRFKTDEKIVQQFVYWQVSGEQNAFAFNPNILFGKPWFATHEAGKGVLYAPWYGKNADGSYSGIYQVDIAARVDDTRDIPPKTKVSTTEELTKKSSIKGKITYSAQITSRKKQIEIMVADNWANVGLPELDDKLNVILDSKYSKRFRTTALKEVLAEYRELLTMFYSYRLQVKNDVNITSQEDVDFQVNEEMSVFEETLKELIAKSKDGNRSKSAYNKFRNLAGSIYMKVWKESYKTYSDNEIQLAYNEGVAKTKPDLRRGLTKDKLPKSDKRGQRKHVRRKETGEKDKAGNPKTKPVYTKEGWYLNKARANATINGQTSNLQYFYHKGIQTQMRPELQDFIEETTGNEAKLPKAIVTAIKVGKLTYEQLITWFRKADAADINDYTFNLINKHFFKNTKITDIQQLDTILTSDIKLWYAIPQALLREGASLEWLVQQNSLEGFMTFLEQADGTSFKKTIDSIIANMNFDRFDINLKEAQTYLRPMVMKHFDGTLGSAMYTAALYINYLSKDAKSRFGKTSLDKENTGGNKGAGKGGESGNQGTLSDIQKTKTKAEAEVDALIGEGASESDLVNALALAGKEVQDKAGKAARLARNEYEKTNRAKEINALFSAISNIKTLSNVSKEDREILAKFLARITANDTFNTEQQPYSKTDLLKVLKALIENPALLNKEGAAKALKILRTRIELRLEEVFMNEIDKNVEKKRSLAESGAIDIKEKIETQEGIEDAATDFESLAQESYDAIRTDFYRYLDKKQLTKTELERFQFLVEQMMYESYNLSYLAMPDEELQARSDMLEVADYAPESIREIIEEKVTEKSAAQTNITNTQTRIKSFGTQIANMVENHQIDFSLLPKEVQDLFDVTEIGPKTNRDIRIKLKESAYKLNPQFNSTEQTDRQKARLESITRITDTKNLLQDVVTAAKQKAYLKNETAKTIREIQKRAQRKVAAQKRKFAQVEEGLRETVFEYKKKMAPTKNTPRAKNLASKVDVSVSVASKVEMPEKLVTLFSTGFETLADTQVQFASLDADGKPYEKGDTDFQSRVQHEVISWNAFYDANRETFKSLTRDDVLDIVDAIQQGIFGFGDLDSQRKIFAFQIFVLGFIYDGTRGNQMLWDLSNEEIDSIRATYETIASTAGSGLNAVKQMIPVVNPVKRVQQRLWEDWGIEPEQSEPFFQSIERLINAKDQETYQEESKTLARILGEVEGLMAKHQQQERDKSRKQRKAEQDALRKKWRGDVNLYEVNHKRWVARKNAGEENIGPEPQYPKKPRELREGFTESNFFKGLMNWRYMSMLSSPATWARNLVSNVMVSGINRAADAVANVVFDIVGKGYRKDQWDLSNRTKVSQEVNDYVDNLVNSITYVVEETDKKGNVHREERKLFDLLYDGTSKYSDRLRLRTGADLFSAFVTQAIEAKYAATHRFDNAALNRVANFVSNRIKDTRFIKAAANRYFKKILQLEIQNGKIDISKPISRDILDLFAEAVILASQDFMHKESALGTMMNSLREKRPKAYAVMSFFFPFMNASFNWFTEFLKLSPFGLAKAIWNSAHLEDVIYRVSSQRAEGRILPSTKAVQYLTRRDVGKGIIGTILWGVGAILAAVGIIRLDDEDDKQYIFIGDAKFDISDIFGSSSLLVGAAIVNFAAKDDATFDDVMDAAFNLLLDGFIAKDLWENFRWSNGMYELFLTQTESILKSFIPQFIQLLVRASNNHNITYSPGTLGMIQRWLNSFIPAFIPGMPLGDKRVNPYSGELESKYAIPFVGEILRSGLFGVRIVWSSVTDGEQLAKEYDVNKNMIEAEITIDGQKVSLGDKGQLNQYYGRLNAASLSELQNKSHLVEMTDGSYKTLSWNNMDDRQRQNVIERTFTKNASYAKIYMWTQVLGHKYYTNQETRTALRELGITSNVYLGDRGYVK